MKHLYGEFTEQQIHSTKEYIRKSIFWLLIYVDPKTSMEYPEIDVNKTFDNLLYRLGGLNKLLLYQKELVMIMSLLEAAKIEYNNPNFEFTVYRKIILDAGAEVLKLKEVDE